MACTNLRDALVVFLLLAPLAACSEGGGEKLPVVVINLGDAGAGDGCIQPTFPPEQPDLFVLYPPRFLTDAPNGQAVVDPGDSIEAEISVNSATRKVFVELRDAWSPEFMIYSTEIDTAGNQTIPVLLLSNSQVLGRFYMKITLCGADCDEREVVFDLNPDMNSGYERTLIENGDVIRVDRTCLDFTADAGIGSGTVIIQ
ncbi:MAG: hypothetical protein AMJ62_15585 [Myxococcales bacterium SG8_38]|nr:MAG: hypothetical protein AMJ62_15585 [Myxococcales bacterium SG8_38]